jgi:tagatose-6-phosphate ketose/aldose isomerase
VSYLAIEEARLAELGATWTAREIEQQPGSWARAQKLLAAQARELDSFVRPLLARADLRIILTGAGSSAYIGEALAPSLLRTLGLRVEAIATTELVSAPRDYLQKHVPTLLVSFGRSGNSPESVAALRLVRQCVDESYQLVFTCNPTGGLYRRCRGEPACYAVLLPEETHDRSFAMTSSFSTMMYAAWVALQGLGADAETVQRLGTVGCAVIQRCNEPLQALAVRAHERVVYLGSKGLKGLASEAALKLLELTDGASVALANSPLGFRHGPKTFVNATTLVMLFVSNDPLTRRYDLDLLRELRTEAVAGTVMAITARADEAVSQGEHLLIPDMHEASDTELAFPFIMCAQLYAFHRSLLMGNSPDNPSANGTVSRVVRGVTLHDL